MRQALCRKDVGFMLATFSGEPILDAFSWTVGFSKGYALAMMIRDGEVTL